MVLKPCYGQFNEKDVTFMAHCHDRTSCFARTLAAKKEHPAIRKLPDIGIPQEIMGDIESAYDRIVQSCRSRYPQHLWKGVATERIYGMIILLRFNRILKTDPAGGEFAPERLEDLLLLKLSHED